MEAFSNRRFTVEEYLAFEREINQKCEFHDGEVFAMAGGSSNHTILCRNIHGELWSRLKGSDCESFTGELKVYIEQANSYVYPDASVICGETDWSNKEAGVATNPTVIIEVLSPGSQEYDRGDKFFKYRQLSSLKEYVLIDQERFVVDVFSRQAASDLWRISRVAGLDQELVLSSVNLAIPMKDLYLGVEH